MASTMPADLPFGLQAWLPDRPCWCVDLGPTLQAMTTCDVWLGLARGDIVPEMKVWREGMPYWTAVAKVPEFALALPDAKVWPPAPSHAAAKLVAAMPVAANHPGLADESAEGAGAVEEELSCEDTGEPPASVVGVLTHAPPGDFVTPAPVVVDHDDAPPVSGARQRLFPRLDRRGAASVVVGAAVAILALALATTGPVPASESKPAAAAGVRMGTVVKEPGPFSDELPAPGWPVTIVPAEAAPTGAPGTTAAPASTISTASTAAKGTDAMDRSRGLTPGRWRTPRGPKASDRGQHRVRASTR